MSKNNEALVRDELSSMFGQVKELETTVLRSMAEEDDEMTAQILADAYNEAKGGLRTLLIYYRTKAVE